MRLVCQYYIGIPAPSRISALRDSTRLEPTWKSFPDRQYSSLRSMVRFLAIPRTRSGVSMFNTRFWSCQNHNIAILSLWTPKSVHTGCVSYFRHNLINRCRFSIFLHHFGHFDSESGISHSEKVTFWGRGHFCFHIFHQEIIFKNRKRFCFLKE